MPILPARLAPGSHVRVVAPSQSRPVVMDFDNTPWIEQRMRRLGLEVSFGRHVDVRNRQDSAPVADRLADLHEAFADDDVDAVWTVIGGYNANELLPHLDVDLIAAHPKILCGYSDITALQNAIWARTGLVTYSGPHWSSFGMRDHFDLTERWWTDCLFASEPYEVVAAPTCTDDAWFADQDDRHPSPTQWWVLQPGRADGRIVGGNLCTLNLLQGTGSMPDLADTVLFLEDDLESNAATFRRDLHSLFQQAGADRVRALVIGRFQAASEVVRDDLVDLVASLPALAGKPVLANVDFGHTFPLLTFPIGGAAEVQAEGAGRIVISEH